LKIFTVHSNGSEPAEDLANRCGLRPRGDFVPLSSAYIERPSRRSSKARLARRARGHVLRARSARPRRASAPDEGAAPGASLGAARVKATLRE
jgi:hypothetical protein